MCVCSNKTRNRSTYKIVTEQQNGLDTVIDDPKSVTILQYD